MILKILTLINNKPWHWWTSSCGHLRSMSISFALWNWIVFLPLILILNLLLKPRTLERKAVVKIIETYCLCDQFKIFNSNPLWILFSQAEKYVLTFSSKAQTTTYKKATSIKVSRIEWQIYFSLYLPYNLCTEHCLHIKQLYKWCNLSYLSRWISEPCTSNSYFQKNMLEWISSINVSMSLNGLVNAQVRKWPVKTVVIVEMQVPPFNYPHQISQEK